MIVHAETLRARLKPPERLTGNAVALMGNTGLTSLLGVVFWVGATRLYPADVLGQDAGLIAGMMLLSSLSELSLGQGIPRLLPQVLSRRRLAVAAAYAVTAAVAVLLAAGFALLAPELSPGFAFLHADHGLQALLVGAVVLWNVFALQDAALVAVRKAALVPLENAVFGVLKILLMVMFAQSRTAHGVLLGWVLAMVIVVPPVNWFLMTRLLRAPNAVRPTAPGALPLEDRRKVGRYLAGDYAASLLGQGCNMLLPVLVLATLGQRASAYFYVAFTIAVAVNALAIGLSTSLVVEGAHEERELRRLAQRTLHRYATLLLPAMLLAIAAAPFLLQPFGVEYTQRATSLLQLLLAGCIPQTLVTVYLGMERVRGKAGRILAVQALAFASVLTGVGLLMPAHGILGVGLAWLAAWALTAFAVLPGLRSAVRSPETLRRAAQHRQP